MDDFISDYRRSNNRYEIYKHKRFNKKQEGYWIKRAKISWNRFPTPCYTEDISTIYHQSIDDTDEFEPEFYSTDDALALQLCHLVYKNDIDQIETLRLCSVLGSFRQSINTFARAIGCSYPVPTPLMVAASTGNDKLVRMFLNESPLIDVNLKLDNICQHLDLCCHTEYYCKFPERMNCYCEYCKSEISRSALWIACFNGHLNIVRTLVEIGKADVNLTDHKNWTPLRAAIFNNHIDIVQYLIEQANAIIDESRDLFIAIQIGSFDIVDYLLSKGCDTNTRLIDQDLSYLQADYTLFPLHYAIDCYSGDLSIIKTILKHGADPTVIDDKGWTALHIAIQHTNEEIVREILHYGFKHDQRDNNNRTPLMLAIVFNETNIINILYAIIPRQQYIDELMLLASQYALKDDFEFFFTNFQAFIYYKQALELQEPNSDAIPCDVYQFRRECQTVDELRIIEDNSQLMYIQALLVYERLLPQRNEIHLVIPKLIDLSDDYWSNGDYNQCLLVLIHVYPMTLSCKENLFNHWDRTCLRKLIDLLDHLIREEKIQYIDKILKVFEWSFNQFDDIERISRSCIKVTYLIESNQINNDDKYRLIHLIKQAIRKTYNSEVYMGNLFYQVVSACIRKNEPLFQWIPPENVVRLLIHCDANVDQIDSYSGLRPIHLVAYAIDIEHARLIAEILITAGAHTDCRDHQGLLPEEHAENIEIRDLLHSKRSMSLKCQCTHLIISKEIKYEPYLSTNLKKFILMHQGR